MDDNEVIAGFLIIITIVVIFFYLIIYVVIPLIVGITGIGLTVGGGVSLYNYAISFKNNVQLEGTNI